MTSQNNSNSPETLLESIQSKQKDQKKIESVEADNSWLETHDTKSKVKKGFSISKLASLLLILGSLVFLVGGAFYARQISRNIDDIIVNSESGCQDIFDLDCYTPLIPWSNEPEVVLKGQESGRTNILFVGADSVAGLADTIILVSYYHQEKKIATLNIPRDTYVRATYKNSNGKTITLTDKINALYPYAQRDGNNEGAGAGAVVSFIEEEFDIDIHYWATTNFIGVQQIVDELDGVEVEVDKAFTDCQFPRPNYAGYIRPCPSFEVGKEKMNGERALIYARSRKSPQDSGDFARSRRQSIVINSILKEIKSQGTFVNLNSIKAYLDILGDNLRTNMGLDEMLAVYKLLEGVNLDEDFVRAIWDDGGGILCAGDASTRGYNLVYCGGSVPGTNTDSIGSIRARNFVQDLLVQAQTAELFTSEVKIFGNLSNDTTAIRDELFKIGFQKIVTNNQYSSQIDPATATSTEEITVYIEDPKIRELFRLIEPKINLSTKIQTTIPDGLILPESAQDSPIIIWVESIS